MLIKVQSTFENKIQNLGRQGQIYIVPTLDGLKLLVLNLVLLIIGLVYANNYVLLFNFILFCLFVGSMFYTHFNLHGLKLISAKLNPLHVKEHNLLVLHFKSSSALGHHFLNIGLKNTNISLENKGFNFSIKENESTIKVEIPVLGNKRGTSSLSRLSISTRFPFHLFRAFARFDVGIRVMVYPEKRKLDLHEVNSGTWEKNGIDEEYHLKNFQPGDSLKRIHWKKFAQTGKLFSKQINAQNELPVILGFSKEDLDTTEKESELASICFSLHELHSQNIPYGLVLDTLVIEPDHSPIHLNRCLKALAEYET